MPIFGNPVVVNIPKGTTPGWVDKVKFPQMKTLELQREKLNEEINELGSMLPLIYENGEALENSLLEALRFLGLKANKSEPGFTVDILAETVDGSMKFGLEATGTNGAIKKESKKLIQLSEFQLIKEQGEKAVLLANTYNTTPIAERSQENFTRQVIGHFSKHDVLLMTGWDMYSLIKDVLAGSRTRDELIRLLYNQSGVFKLT